MITLPEQSSLFLFLEGISQGSRSAGFEPERLQRPLLPDLLSVVLLILVWVRGGANRLLWSCSVGALSPPLFCHVIGPTLCLSSIQILSFPLPWCEKLLFLCTVVGSQPVSRIIQLPIRLIKSVLLQFSSIQLLDVISWFMFNPTKLFSTFLS